MKIEKYAQQQKYTEAVHTRLLIKADFGQPVAVIRAIKLCMHRAFHSAQIQIQLHKLSDLNVCCKCRHERTTCVVAYIQVHQITARVVTLCHAPAERLQTVC